MNTLTIAFIFISGALFGSLIQTLYVLHEDKKEKREQKLIQMGMMMGKGVFQNPFENYGNRDKGQKKQ